MGSHPGWDFSKKEESRTRSEQCDVLTIDLASSIWSSQRQRWLHYTLGRGFTPIPPLITWDWGVIRFPLLFIGEKSVRVIKKLHFDYTYLFTLFTLFVASVIKGGMIKDYTVRFWTLLGSLERELEPRSHNSKSFVRWFDLVYNPVYLLFSAQTNS